MVCGIRRACSERRFAFARTPCPWSDVRAALRGRPWRPGRATATLPSSGTNSRVSAARPGVIRFTRLRPRPSASRATHPLGCPRLGRTQPLYALRQRTGEPARCWSLPGHASRDPRPRPRRPATASRSVQRCRHAPTGRPVVTGLRRRVPLRNLMPFRAVVNRHRIPLNIRPASPYSSCSTGREPGDHTSR